MTGNSVLHSIGVAAWVGGIATALAALAPACDIDDDDDDCEHAERVDLELAAMVQPMEPDEARPDRCDRSAHPSVYVMPSLRHYDFFVPVDVDAVWYEHDGHTYEARCLEAEGGCIAWIAGYELEGPITVSAEHCEVVVSETVTVEPLPDRCHVRTAYLVLEMSTRGCLASTSPEPPEPPPPPEWPFELADVGDGSEHPGHGDPGLPGRRASDLVAWEGGPPPPAADDVASPG